MSVKEAYKRKVEAELELAHARMVEFQAKAKTFSAEARLKYAKHLEELEHGVDATKSLLTQLSEAGEDGWEKFREGVEKALTSLSTSLQNAAAKFKD
jgi:hypothetical protein